MGNRRGFLIVLAGTKDCYTPLSHYGFILQSYQCEPARRPTTSGRKKRAVQITNP